MSVDPNTHERWSNMIAQAKADRAQALRERDEARARYQEVGRRLLAERERDEARAEVERLRTERERLEKDVLRHARHEDCHREIVAEIVEALREDADRAALASAWDAGHVAADFIERRFLSPLPREHRWQTTGTVDTGHNPVRREWACVHCDERQWSVEPPEPEPCPPPVAADTQ